MTKRTSTLGISPTPRRPFAFNAHASVNQRLPASRWAVPDESSNTDSEENQDVGERRRVLAGFTTSLVVHVVTLLGLSLFIIEGVSREPISAITLRESIEDPIEEFEVIEFAPERLDISKPVPHSSDDLTVIAEVQDSKSEVMLGDVDEALIDDVIVGESFGFDLPNGSALLATIGNGGDGDDFDAEPLGAKVEFFGVEASGHRFVFVTDCSGSMDGPPLERLKVELRDAIGSLPGHVEFYIVFFNNMPMPMHAAKCVQATDLNKRQHLDWVDTIVSKGGTDPSGAMEVGLQMQPTALFFLTDGVFDSQSTLDVIGKLNGERHVQIHTIAIGDPGAEPILRQIADENKGTYRFVPR